MRRWLSFIAVLGCVACDGGSNDSSAGSGGEAGAGAGEGGSSGQSGSGGIAGTGSGGGPSHLPTGEELASSEALAAIGEQTCEASYQACGGDPLGTWQITSLDCNSNSPNGVFGGLPLCGEVLVRYAVQATGMMSFTSEGVPAEQTIELDIDFQNMSHLSLNDACLMQETNDRGESACYYYEASLRQRVEEGQEVSCTFEGERCECDLMRSTHYGATGSYSVDGTNLFDGATYSPFCVQDNTMTFRMTDADDAFLQITMERMVASECTDHRDCEGGLSCCTSAAGTQCLESPLPFPLPGIDPVLCPPHATPANIPDGQPCTDARFCASGACIDGLCVDGLADGQRCLAPTDCMSGSCFQGFCSGDRKLGAECSTADQCDSNRCCTDLTPSVCADDIECPGVEGDRCTTGSDCYEIEGAYEYCVDERYCSYECGGNLIYECEGTRDDKITACVDARCRPACEQDSDCSFLGTGYTCQDTVDEYGDDAKVCLM